MNFTEKAQLSNKFAYWFRVCDETQDAKLLKQSEYETQIHKIGEFQTVLFSLT
jgi:hypothetical protein